LVKEHEELIAHCGLYCGECFNYQGKIADLARDLRKELRKAKFDTVAQGLSKYFKDFKEYDTCYRVLGAMVKLRCKRSCRDGGGNPMCKIRICCQDKELAGCWQCSEFETCKKLDFLKPVHMDAHLKNLRKLKRIGIEGFLKGPKSF
jgi:hypothetical protein